MKEVQVKRYNLGVDKDDKVGKNNTAGQAGMTGGPLSIPWLLQTYRMSTWMGQKKLVKKDSVKQYIF